MVLPGAVLSILSAATLGATVIQDAPLPAADDQPIPQEAASDTPMEDAVTTVVEEPAPPMAFADLSDEDIFVKAADALEGIGTLRARFEQFSPSGTITTGQLSLSRPGRLRFDYDAPSPQLIVASGNNVYVHDADLEETDTYPLRRTPLRFLLTDRLDTDAAELVETYRGESEVALLLRARDEEMQGELALVFSAPDMVLTEWSVFDPSGTMTRLVLSDIEMGVSLPGRLFRRPDDGGQFLRNNR